MLYFYSFNYENEKDFISFLEKNFSASTFIEFIKFNDNSIYKFQKSPCFSLDYLKALNLANLGDCIVHIIGDLKNEKTEIDIKKNFSDIFLYPSSEKILVPFVNILNNKSMINDLKNCIENEIVSKSKIFYLNDLTLEIIEKALELLKNLKIFEEKINRIKKSEENIEKKKYAITNYKKESENSLRKTNFFNRLEAAINIYSENLDITFESKEFLFFKKNLNFFKENIKEIKKLKIKKKIIEKFEEFLPKDLLDTFRKESLISKSELYKNFNSFLIDDFSFYKDFNKDLVTFFESSLLLAKAIPSFDIKDFEKLTSYFKTLKKLKENSFKLNDLKGIYNKNELFHYLKINLAVISLMEKIIELEIYDNKFKYFENEMKKNYNDVCKEYIKCIRTFDKIVFSDIFTKNEAQIYTYLIKRFFFSNIKRVHIFYKILLSRAIENLYKSPNGKFFKNFLNKYENIISYFNGIIRGDIEVSASHLRFLKEYFFKNKSDNKNKEEFDEILKYYNLSKTLPFQYYADIFNEEDLINSLIDFYPMPYYARIIGSHEKYTPSINKLNTDSQPITGLFGKENWNEYGLTAGNLYLFNAGNNFLLLRYKYDDDKYLFFGNHEDKIITIKKEKEIPIYNIEKSW